MISIYAFFAMAATLICSLLAVFVYFTNRKSALNRTFIVAIAFGAYTAFTTFMVIQAESAQTAIFWNKVGFLWPFFLVSLLNFVMIFTQNRLATDKRGYLLLYAPALVFSLLDLTTDQISGAPVVTAYGYTFLGSSNIFEFITTLWTAVVSVSSVALCLRYYLKTADATKKQQAALITLALAYPIVMNVLSKAGFFLFGWYIPYYGVGANAVLCICVGYAIWRYNLFNLNPAIAAENIIATMPDSFILTDSQGQILRANATLTSLLGYKESELVGKQINVLFDRGNKQLFDDITHKQELKNHETEFMTQTGDKKPVSLSSSLIKGKNGNTIGVALIIHDLTRRKQYEEQIVKNERFAAIGELAGMVGHDLRNPLNSIQVATYYIKKKSFDAMDDTSREMLGTIQTSIQYSNKIINDLLDYSRDITLEIEESTATRLTQNALLMVEVPPNIQVVNMTQDSPTILLDNVKMSRVLVNIIKNAFEAMPNGGVLTIKSRQKDADVELSFEDTGVGMSTEVVDKLWKPLFTTKAKGMGFGLAICRRIVEAHGGKIQATSALGKGTIFTVAIPLNRQ